MAIYSNPISAPGTGPAVPAFAMNVFASSSLDVLLIYTDWDAVIPYIEHNASPDCLAVTPSNAGSFFGSYKRVAAFTTVVNRDSKQRISASFQYVSAMDTNKIEWVTITVKHVNYNSTTNASNIPGHPDYIASIITRTSTFATN